MIGTAAFLATLLITIFVPKMSDTPWNEESAEEAHPLRRWDTVITWIMWGGWGLAMIMHFLAENKMTDQLDRLLG